MGMFKRTLSRFGYEKKEEKGDFMVGGGESTDYQIEDYKRAKIKDLEWYYWNYGPLFRGINLKASSIWGRGFRIEHQDKKIIEICEKATLKIPNFKQWVITETSHALSVGKGPGEIIWDDINEEDEKGNFLKDKEGFIIKKKEGKKIIGYNITDPKTFKPIWDRQGYIKYWLQKVTTSTGSTEEMKHKPRKICYFRFHQIADSTEGIGLVETNLPTIKSLMMAQKSTRDLLFRFGSPFVHVTKPGASAKDVRKMKRIGESFNSSTNLASRDNIIVKLIGIEGKSVDISPHIDLLEGNLAGGLGIPKPILFFAGEEVNRATLTELLAMTTVEIKTYQEKLSDIIENQILRPLLLANNINIDRVGVPQIIWESLDEKGEKEVLDNFKTFSDAIDKLMKNGIYTAEEIKTIINEKFKFKKEEK